MVDIAYLKKQKISSGEYRKIFTQDPAKYPPKIKQLVNMLSARSRDGYEMGLRDHRAYYAIDLAYEVPFNQTTPTLVRNIMSKNLSAEQTRDALKEWGLSEDSLFLEVKTDAGQACKVLNEPVFWQILVPIVKAYVKAVVGEIFNERNTSPLLPYQPLKQTTQNQIRCEIQTDIAQTMSTWYGYPAVMRQAIDQMCKYGVMIAFPLEQWHCERQIIDGEKVTIREGIRYIHPHPTRMYADLEYPWTSINTGTGCRFGGHWHIKTYGDILDSRDFWNRKSIFAGTNWFQSPNVGNYFNEVFPCRFPFLEGVGWGQQLTREDKYAIYNPQNDRDKAVFVTEHYDLLVPKQWGLGDYPYPVWHHFTLAGDDTVIWAEPSAYNPMWFMGYDYDEQASRNSSLALELIPWQDHLGNILSQMILTAKQNLLNVIFYNNQAVDKSDIQKMLNMGENKYRSVHMIGYDALKMAAARTDMERVFSSVNLTKTPIQEMLQMIPIVLNIMERVLGISAQAAGGAASHQQGKQEILETSGATKSRINYISASVDEGIDAWKRQLFDASQAYMDTEFLAQVSSDIEDLEKHLEEMGFTIKGRGEDTVLITGNKSKLRLEGFAASNQGPARTNEKEISQVIFQTVGTVAGQEDLHKAVGAKTLLKLIEQAAIMAGAPRDFRLRLDTKDKPDTEVPKLILEAIQQAQAATLKAVEEKIAQPVAKEVAQEQQEIQQIQKMLQKLEGIYKLAAAQQDKNVIKQQEAQAAQKRKDETAQREQARKDEVARRDAARKDEEAQAEIKRKELVAKGELVIASAKASREPKKKP